MNETKENRATFTQGPWKVGDYENEELPILDATGSYVALADSEFSNNAKEANANARLIAAAPEMYAQCKLFERTIVELMMQGETGGYEELEKLREILAKVDGGVEG